MLEICHLRDHFGKFLTINYLFGTFNVIIMHYMLCKLFEVKHIQFKCHMQV